MVKGGKQHGLAFGTQVIQKLVIFRLALNTSEGERRDEGVLEFVMKHFPTKR